MQRLVVVMSHASRAMGGAVRELHFCAALRARGVDARVWRMHEGRESAEEEILGVPVRFCPSDAPEKAPHYQLSPALRDEVVAFAPEVVLYKGLSYHINAYVQAARPAGARYGLIVGGAITDPLVDGAAAIFGEYREQLAKHFRPAMLEGRTMVMPKHIDLSLAGEGAPPRRAEFDIVNVGTFAEKRKNQGALLPFAARHRLAFVGGGPLLAEAQRTVRKAGHAENVTFFKRLPHAEVFGVLRRSRIMVHSSVGDGLPRATVEAMACGVPVVALRETIAGGIPATAGLLVSEAGLPHAVELLLTDDALRIQMGRAARRHVERNHGPAAIAAAAEQAMALLSR
ncbi:glycosyltransferase family 4 protein [Roseomonas sp. AR75]|uniref:glycosyltransferase family 4 protein n=1 Tax=Roseomonas sp. AR75 TaxID=2562311 RepID=UPI0010C123E1|nr:glycosyltransferase family 4 protein [Roseomonas sp. AR75]